MNMFDTTLADEAEAASDPEMLINFLHYALDDVRKLSERSAHLLEQAISALAQEAATQAAMPAHPRTLS